jgi:pimeloyl-ACP methyl ester carboxylesterase
MVGSGTFDPVARARYKAILASRIDAAVRARLDAVDREEPDPDRRLALRADVLMALELVDPVPEEFEVEPVDALSNAESWADMVRLQEAEVYPASFARVRAPVLMLHGDHDPHPFEEIRASLLPFVPHLESALLPRCGHYPWVERDARGEFFRVLREWVGRQGGSLNS